MSKFKFPRNPGTQRENPFEDARGQNPFSDGEPPPADAIAENLFAVPADSEQRSYVPGDYEAILVPNAKGAWRLAVIGLVLSGLGVIGAGFGILTYNNWISPLFYALPLQFAGLASALPACIIAGRDLRAIKAGAMKGTERGKSRLAWWIGSAGVLMGAVPVVLYFALLIAHALAS